MNEKYSKKDFEKILEKYSIGKLLSYKKLPKALENTVYYFKTSKGEFVLKLFERSTKTFGKQKMLLIKKEKNTKKISLNTKNPLTRQLLATIILEQIINSKSIKQLIKEANYIGVYGSTLTGNIDSKSDIDIFTITTNKLNPIKGNQIKKELEKELEKEVDIKMFTQKEFSELKKEDPIFYQELNNSKTIWGEK